MSVVRAVVGQPVDVSPQIARRASELYEQRGRQGGRLRIRRSANFGKMVPIINRRRRFTEDEAGYVNALAGFSIAKAALNRDAGFGLPKS